MPQKSILFLCVRNSARSQIAEGLVNAVWRDRFQAFSAGSEPTRVHLAAIRAMAEIGIDISAHRSKSFEEFEGQPFDYVVMVCDDKAADCPFFSGGKEYIPRAFPDPAACAGTEDEILECFRRTRDDVRRWIGERFGPEYEGPSVIELTVDKFIFRFPEELFYSDDGLWLRFEGNKVRIGLTDFLQQRSGDVTFAIPKERGTAVRPGDEVAVIETIKVNLSLLSPIAGKVLETNPALETAPELVNQDPYGKGWVSELEVEDPVAAMRALISAGEYLALARIQAEAEVSR
jgi:arsenate reductase (thioredoxin)